MGIPVGMKYTSKVRASTLKPVHCEGCGAHFAYRMTREAEGTGSSMLFLDNDGAKQRASDEASAAVRQKLRDEADNIPCPRCGVYQPEMVVRLKSEHHGYLRVIGIIAIIVGALAAFCGALSLLGVSAVGVGLLVLRGWLARRHDPNANAAARIGYSSPDVGLVTPEQYQQVLEAQRRNAA